MELILGLTTGVVFGILLQKAEVLRFDKQVGFMLFKDATILRFMLSAIVVGAVGLRICAEMGMLEFEIKNAALGPVALGGLLFGAGWAVAGYCPGTAIGALGEGRLHAFWVILGMITGAGVYAESRHLLRWKFLKLYDYGPVTLPQFTNLSPWLIITALVAGTIILFVAIAKKL
jgi:uncharacterized protein